MPVNISKVVVWRFFDFFSKNISWIRPFQISIGTYFRGWHPNPRNPRKLIPVKIYPIKVSENAMYGIFPTVFKYRKKNNVKILTQSKNHFSWWIFNGKCETQTTRIWEIEFHRDLKQPTCWKCPDFLKNGTSFTWKLCVEK